MRVCASDDIGATGGSGDVIVVINQLSLLESLVSPTI
jgi:hypothetical protein